MGKLAINIQARARQLWLKKVVILIGKNKITLFTINDLCLKCSRLSNSLLVLIQLLMRTDGEFGLPEPVL